MSDQYYVVGNPVAHSKSPEIHRLFAQQTGEDIEYGKCLVDMDNFDEVVTHLIDDGVRGANVTVPYKESAYALCSGLSEQARRAAAVNTLSFAEDGQCFGDNTDGAGLLTDLSINHAVQLSGKRILLLGAGGAVKGVLAPLLGAKPAALLIVNRTAHKAEQLAADFSDLGPLEGGGYERVAGQRFDLIINGTSLSLEDRLPPLPDSALRAGGVVYDMCYADRDTAFVRWGKSLRAGKSLDGLGMLVEQAAQSFNIWRGKMPDTGPVYAALRRA